MQVRFLVGLVALAVTAGSAGDARPPAQPLTIVENGHAKAPIVVFKDATYLTRLAADDLADYIGKVSGARPPVIQGWPDPLPAHAIWVGVQPGIEKFFPGIDLEFHHPEEILIAANDAHVLIAGRDRWVPGHVDVPSNILELGSSRKNIIRGVQQEYGTANAVTAFMHGQLGIRWLWPGEVDIPVRSTVALAPFVHRYHPQVRSRALMFWHLSRGRTGGPGDPESDWARYNRIQLDSLEARAGEHGFSDWWERFGRTHPEYFALQPDGTRSGFPEPRYAKICESNPAVWEQWLKDVDRALVANPGQVGFSAAANDSWRSGHCTCANCRAWDDPGGPSRKFHWRTESREGVALADRQVRFANVLARKLKERYPERTLYVSVLAYGLSRPAPISAVPDDNVIIGSVANFCFDLNARDGASPDNFREVDEFRDWAKVAPHLYWRPNVNRDIQYGVPLDTRVIREHFRVLADFHAVGIYIDTIYRYWALNGPAYYLMAQLAWNPQQDGKGVLEDYFEHGFDASTGHLADCSNRFFENSPHGIRRDRTGSPVISAVAAIFASLRASRSQPPQDPASYEPRPQNGFLAATGRNSVAGTRESCMQDRCSFCEASDTSYLHSCLCFSLMPKAVCGVIGGESARAVPTPV